MTTGAGLLALDVGGTTVEAALITEDGGLLSPVREVPSPEAAGSEQIIGRLTHLLDELVNQGAVEPRAAGVAMPGPFDYQRGVSRMRHKLPSLYGVDLKAALQRHLGVPVLFLNDGAAFALGAWWKESPREPRLLGVTLGTGLGAGFVVEGRSVGEEEGAPPGGEMWSFPYRDGLLEEYVSGRALVGTYGDLTGERAPADQIAARAGRGDPAALQAFSRLGEALGEGLALATARFRPSRVVCGGGISRAFPLFGPSAQAAFARVAGFAAPFSPARTGHLALLGAARHALLELSR